MDALKTKISELPQALKIGTWVGAPVLIGVAGGLLTWWAEDAVKRQIDSQPWLLPVIGGVATGGLTAYILIK